MLTPQKRGLLSSYVRPGRHALGYDIGKVSPVPECLREAYPIDGEPTLRLISYTICNVLMKYRGKHSTHGGPRSHAMSQTQDDAADGRVSNHMHVRLADLHIWVGRVIDITGLRSTTVHSVAKHTEQ